ncbi:MAG: DUF1453 family protein [Brevundimonas sp.]|uniref:CcdC protein domain-containing protein n=1 Tax=Brevundimonas sp. TaxID=1871086 RepID=UPI0025BD40F3|nr:CcdC protein domain-containing protein [Brevundimonas sp.]MBX3476872.1 DUF1453 family protein [Brevundimonas sp.]
MEPQQYIPLGAVAVMLPLVLLRNRRPRTLRPQWMWVAPAIIVPLMGLAIWGTSMQPGVAHASFGPLDWLILAMGLVLGAAAGWQRGRMMTIEKHSDGALKAQASPLGLILIVLLLFGRRALGAWLEPHAASLGLSAIAVADAFLLFVAAMIVLQRIEMYVRARRILAGGSDAHVESAA